jgi:hypothetical protein
LATYHDTPENGLRDRTGGSTGQPTLALATSAGAPVDGASDHLVTANTSRWRELF